MIGLHHLFPEVAEAEVRVAKVLKHSRLPTDDYALVEHNCVDPGCDCRRVLLEVVSRHRARGRTAALRCIVLPGVPNSR